MACAARLRTNANLSCQVRSSSCKLQGAARRLQPPGVATNHIALSHPRRLRAVAGIIGAGALLVLVACASTPEPKEQMAVGRAAVERVSGPAGADAPLEVASTRDKIARANRAIAAKDYAMAPRLAAEAEADAALAEAKSRASRSDGALESAFAATASRTRWPRTAQTPTAR